MKRGLFLASHSPQMITCTFQAHATALIPNTPDVETAALGVHDWCVNHPEDIPDALSECYSDEFVETISNYLSLAPGAMDLASLTISLDSDEANCDNEIFEFLCSHFASVQEAPFLSVSRGTFDSRTGANGWSQFFGQDGKEIDVEAVLTQALSNRQSPA
ncbi:MAG: hypothetical protein ACO4B5_13225 [Steroidobacteraceae bacterium]